MVKLKEKIEQLLKTYPEARDDDFFLYYLYVQEYEPGVIKPEDGLREILKAMSESKLTSIFTVSRVRRSIQETNPSLSGNKEDRMKLTEKVKHDVKQLKKTN